MAKHNLALTSLASTAFVACLASCATYDAPDHLGENAGAGGATAGANGSAGAATAAAGTAGAQGTAGAPNGGALGNSGTAGQNAGASGASSGGGAGGAASGGGGAGGGGAGSGGAGGGGGGQPAVPANAIEAIFVPGSGAAVASKASLDNGELYLLKATGTVSAGGVSFDAEYGGFAAGTNGQDMVSGTDVGVDIGIKVDRTPAGTTAGRKKWFGAYRADHSYYVIVTGAGAPLSTKLALPAGSNGTGALTVVLMRLSPMAPALAPATETVMANVTKPTVQSTTTTAQGVVYLLQATGDGKTGGNNLGRGDADWMDYAADGTGKVDIGDQNVDYGLGVDESDPKVTPRQHWWGPWRKDHSYYMLFAGTGNTVGFSYYDVGDYGDNSKTDKITVHIFPVP